MPTLVIVWGMGKNHGFNSSGEPENSLEVLRSIFKHLIWMQFLKDNILL